MGKGCGDISPKKIPKRPTLLAVRELQVKTTVRSCFTPSRTAQFKLMGNDKGWREFGEVGTLVLYRWECQVEQCFGTQFGNSSKVNWEGSHDPATLFLSTRIQGNENLCPHTSMYTNVHSSVVHKQPQSRNNANVLQRVNGHMRCGQPTQWSIICPPKAVRYHRYKL